jgi:hypothetical protein
MKHVKQVYPFDIEPFAKTLEYALNDLEAQDFDIVSVHVLHDGYSKNIVIASAVSGDRQPNESYSGNNHEPKDHNLDS